MKPIRIAFCITDLDIGGAEQALCNLVLGLDARQWRPAVFCLGAAGPLAETLRNRDIPVCCLGARHAWDVRVVVRLARALTRWKPRLLQTFLFHANVAGRLAGRWAGVPFILCGARVAERRSRWPLVIDNLTARLADRLVCVSQAVARFSLREAHWPRSRVAVISNGVDFERFASAPPADLTSLGIGSDDFVILFVGRLDPQKGPQFLLNAFREVAAKFPQAHLLMVGRGPLRDRLQQHAAALQLLERVHFNGWRADVPQLLKASHVLVLPSLWEGMPNVVLEAMAAGIPVVATRVEGAEELVFHNETGLLVEPGNPALLADAILTLAASAAMRQRMSVAGQSRAVQHFLIAQMVRRYERLYEWQFGLSKSTVPAGP